MSAAADQLPNDIEEMKRLFLAQAADLEKLTTDLAAASAELAAARAGLMSYAIEIEKLKFQLARFRCQKYGSCSERIEREIAQLELRLKELEATKAKAEAKGRGRGASDTDNDRYRAGKNQEAAPQAPRETAAHNGRTGVASVPYTRLRRHSAQGGEDVTEVLKYIPGRFEVERHVRPAMSCRKCETMVQAPMPALPIPRGEADASVLAHVATAKYCDHIPLYRQSAIYARDGIELDRSLVAHWNGIRGTCASRRGDDPSTVEQGARLETGPTNRTNHPPSFYPTRMGLLIGRSSESRHGWGPPS